MDLTRVIVGQIVTEKSERQKMDRTYTLHVDQNANKIDVKNALKEHFDVEVSSVRVMRTTGKERQLGQGRVIQKRHPAKKVLVTLTKKSKALDLAQFKVS